MDFNDKKNISGGTFVNKGDDFKLGGPPNEVNFLFKGVQPPPLKYIQLNDALFVHIYSHNIIGQCVINLRILTLDQGVIPVQFRVAAAAQTGGNIFTFPLPEGFLLSCDVVSNGWSSPAYVFCMVGLSRGPNTTNDVYDLLVSGYIRFNKPLAWPQQSPLDFQDGPGMSLSVQQANPGAGADWTYTVPANIKQRLVSVSALLTTAVAVANRDVTLVIDDGTHILAQVTSGFALVASLTNQYTFGDSLNQSAAFNNVSQAPTPSNMILPAGFRVRASTANIQAADQWSNIWLLLQSWLDPV